MPRGVAQHYIDRPEYLTCWCGKRFQRMSDNHKQCSAYHRKLASIVRNLVPRSMARIVAPATPTPTSAAAPQDA